MRHFFGLKQTIIATVITFAAVLAPSAHAQLSVIDPANLIENILSALYSLEEVDNQLQQLENESTMLSNEQKHLTGLNLNTWNGLQSALTTTTQLLQRAQGLGFTPSTSDAQFAQQYPDVYSASISGDQMARDAQTRWENARQALQTTLAMQAQASQNFAGDENTLSTLLDHSQSAVGQLQVSQATNQLLALQSRQAIQEQQLRIAQDRAVALEQARTTTVAAQAREVQRRFLGDGTHYTPATVNFYGN